MDIQMGLLEKYHISNCLQIKLNYHNIESKIVFNSIEKNGKSSSQNSINFLIYQ